MRSQELSDIISQSPGLLVSAHRSDYFRVDLLDRICGCGADSLILLFQNRGECRNRVLGPRADFSKRGGGYWADIEAFVRERLHEGWDGGACGSAELS